MPAAKQELRAVRTLVAALRGLVAAAKANAPTPPKVEGDPTHGQPNKGAMQGPKGGEQVVVTPQGPNRATALLRTNAPKREAMRPAPTPLKVPQPAEATKVEHPSGVTLPNEAEAKGAAVGLGHPLFRPSNWQTLNECINWPCPCPTPMCMR